MKNLEKIKKILSEEPKLIEIKRAKKLIFVGDTHGDFEASQKVIKDYLLARRSLGEGGKPGNKIVFLGDYVDRGPHSKKNLDFLLKTKIKYPNQIYLLQGNHEGHHILKFYPAEFWESLGEKYYKKYTSIVEKFPLAVVTDNIIALHGVPPDIKITRPGRVVEEINKIKLGNEEWRQITWGDFEDEKGEYLGIDPFTGRPQFGRDYFFKMMERFKKKILIRSHQPTSPLFMFDNRCLTIFTSSAYTRERTIAIYDFKKPINTAKDLEIVKI